MKKTLAILALSSLALMAADAPKADFSGFLGIESCAKEGVFKDCSLQKYFDGEKVVAIIDGKTYQIDRQSVSKTKFDLAIMQNDVKFYGSINGDTLTLDNMSYIAVKKEFSKGCM